MADLSTYKPNIISELSNNKHCAAYVFKTVLLRLSLLEDYSVFIPPVVPEGFLFSN